jgi:hypothetical protein
MTTNLFSHRPPRAYSRRARAIEARGSDARAAHVGAELATNAPRLSSSELSPWEVSNVTSGLEGFTPSSSANPPAGNQTATTTTPATTTPATTSAAPPAWVQKYTSYRAYHDLFTQKEAQTPKNIAIAAAFPVGGGLVGYLLAGGLGALVGAGIVTVFGPPLVAAAILANVPVGAG